MNHSGDRCGASLLARVLVCLSRLLRRRTACSAALLLLVLAFPAPALAQSDARAVLLLYADPRLRPRLIETDTGLRSVLESGSPAPIHVHTEYLDLSWFRGDTYEGRMRELLRNKYADVKLDLIVAIEAPAVQFLFQHRDRMFPSVPVVFTATSMPMVAAMKDEDITGVSIHPAWSEAVDLILRLHPNTRRVAVVTGASGPDRLAEADAKASLSKHAHRVELTYLAGLPTAELVRTVAGLPAGTAVLYWSPLQDGAGRTFISNDALASMVATARVPIYGLSETTLGQGIVGGPLLSFREIGVTAGKLALRVLNGERPGPAGIVEATPTYAFDWRELQQWRISERRLPAGSAVRFREMSLWERYRWYAVPVAAILLLQSLLVVGLLVERVWRKRAQASIEDRLRFEKLVSRLSASFIDLPLDQVEGQIDNALGLLVEAFDVDRASLLEVRGSPDSIPFTHSRGREGLPPPPIAGDRSEFPTTWSRMKAGQPIAFSRLDELPPDAATDRRSYAALGVKSMATVPIVMEGVTLGALSLVTRRRERSWPDETITRLRLLAELFAAGLLRRRTQAALRESEDRFRAIADSVPLIVWMTAPDGTCSYFNRRGLEFSGRPLPELLGDLWHEVVHPGDLEEVVATARSACAGRREFLVEFRARRADGEFRWILGQGVPRFDPDGRFTGYVGSAVDVTDLRAAQQAVFESRKLATTIFTSLHGHVVAVDRQGVIIAVNSSWRKLAERNGVDPAAVCLGANYLAVTRAAAAGGDADAKRALEAIESVLEGRASSASMEYPCHWPGAQQWFRLAVEALDRPEGGAVLSHIDVTARRHAEEEVRRQRDDLAHALRVTSLGELAASVAHEINQPLAAITTNAQTALRLLDGGAKPETVEEALGDIVHDAGRAAKVIRQLRALFRKSPVGRKPVEVNGIITEVTTLLHSDMQRHHVSLRSQLGNDLPVVFADPIQLQQVILNVFTNAIEAMERVHDRPRILTVETSQREPAFLAITVRDTGVGVEDADLDRIFERFVSTKVDGLGLGLSISRSIIVSHGGRIWATRNPDWGTTMHIELPCEEEHPA